MPETPPVTRSVNDTCAARLVFRMALISLDTDRENRHVPFFEDCPSCDFFPSCAFSLSSDERDVEASGFLRRGAARRPFSLAHPHVQRLTGKMAKSTNHTAHNQSYNNHRNGACCPRPGAPRGVDPGEARCFHAIAKHSRRETYISAASARRPRGVCASCAANDPGSDARSSGTP